MASSQIFSFDGGIIFISAIILVYVIISLLQKLKPGTLEKIGVRLEGGAILYRTERLNSAIVSFARRHARAIKLLGDASTIGGIGLMAFALFYFHSNLLSFLLKPETASPVSPIIPGVTLGLDALPYFLIAVFLTIVPHELAHALTASAEGLPLKSTGLFLMLVFPGGFAEIDEEELGKSNLRTKLRVLSSGSFTNILSFALLVVLAMFLVHPAGVKVAATIHGYPAEGVLEANDVILEVNGIKTPTLEDFTRILETMKPGETVLLKVQRGGKIIDVSLTLAPRPGNTSRGFLGVQIQQQVNNELLYNILYWCMILTSSVAIINMLPALPLDGGRVFQALIEKVVSLQRAKQITIAFTIYTAFLVIFNIAFSTSIYGLIPFP